MGGNLPIGNSPLIADLINTQPATPSTGSGEVLNCIFPPPSNNPAANTVTPMPPTETQAPAEPAFKTDVKAFKALNLPEDAKPQKEINGVKIYATGAKAEIKTAKIDGKMVVRFGDDGQAIRIPLGQMQKGASIVYNGGKLAVVGLKDAIIEGRRDDKFNDTSVNNQIMAKGCSGCTFDMNDKSNGFNERRDDLVMDGCKNAKVLTGQNNAIVGLNGTSADVSYYSVVGQKEYNDPVRGIGWINKEHTNVAYDETSNLSSNNRGTVNRDISDPLIRDVNKTQGLTAEANAYQLKDGTLGSATDLLLSVISDDSKNAKNGGKSMFNDNYTNVAYKLSNDKQMKQLSQITNNWTDNSTEIEKPKKSGDDLAQR